MLPTAPTADGFPMHHALLYPLLCGLLWLGAAGHAPADTALPSLGDSASALVSPADERRLGQIWLGLFRSQAPVVDDPLLQDYLEHLVHELAFHSELADRRLSV